MSSRSKTFQFIGMDLEKGSIEKGEVKAIHERGAVASVEQLGLEVLSVNEVKKSIFQADITLFTKATPNQVYNFTRQLSVMLKAGVPLVDALDSLHSESSGPMVNKIIDDIIEDVSGGNALSIALEKHPKMFDSMYTNIVRAGESAGVLDKVLFQLADFIASDLKLKMGIKQAIRYPAIVVGITVLVGIFAVTYILPRFSTLFASTSIDLPLPTRILLGMDTFIQDQWYLIIGVIGLIIASIIATLRNPKGRYLWHKNKIGLPISGPISLKMSISRFVHVLETLDRTGVPILTAIEISGKTTGNDFIQSKLQKVTGDVQMGRKLATSLTKYTSAIFPSQMLKMIQVGESAGSLDDMLVEIAEMTDAEIKDHVLKLTATIEPLISVFMGFMILTLALSIFLPIWDMYEAMSAG
ncbi:MAG: type II secretion system F family protein [Candidatus Neomarinimicrobiota bacterium]